MSDAASQSSSGSAHKPWSSGRVDPWVECVLAPNPGLMTLDGTNTWLIGEPGCGQVIVLDPGPDDVRHRAAIRRAVARRDARVGLILLSHGHLDHREGAPALAQEWGVDVRSVDPQWCRWGPHIVEGEQIAAAGVELSALATPGHTADSLSLLLPSVSGPTPRSAALFTGDSVLGRGTAVIAHPDGVLADYLTTLRRFHTVAREHDVARLLPGHGPLLEQPQAVIQAYLDHRAERLDAVRAAVAHGAQTPAQVVALVYADVDEKLWPAAELSVAAQLAYLGTP